jgi:hypothetical protein
MNQNDGQYNTNAMLLKSKPLRVDKAERKFHHNIDNGYTYTNIFVVVTDADNSQWLLLCRYNKKSMKIPKGQSESMYRRRTDNNVQKKINKRTHNDLQNIHYKAKDGVTQTPLRFVFEE